MEAPIAEIKPNIKKAFILNIMFVGAIVFLIISSLVYIHSIVGLKVFIDAFKELGYNISPSSLLAYSIILTLFVTAILLILDYVALGKISYTIYPDKMVYSKNFFIMQISDKTIPFANITKISYERKIFLNSAKVIVELTGMKENKIEMNFIDNADNVVREIQNLIREYRARYYAQYSQDYRYQNIIEKY